MSAAVFAHMSDFDVAKRMIDDPLAKAEMYRRWDAQAALPAIDDQQPTASDGGQYDHRRELKAPTAKASLTGAVRRMLPSLMRQGLRKPMASLSDAQRAKSRARRRTRGSDGKLPPEVRAHFTEAQRAALSVIAQDVAKRGRCTMPVDRVATLAGVCVRSVQYAITLAVRLRFLMRQERPRRGARNETNVISIRNARWLDWLGIGAVFSGIGCKSMHTTEKPSFSNPVSENEHPFSPMMNHGNGLVRGERALKTGVAVQVCGFAPP